jgi:ABC-type dipeptide/oligopeptide/nickel transport system permease subunit
MAGVSTAVQHLQRVFWRAWWIVAVLPGLAIVVIAVRLLSQAARYVLAGQ